MHGTNVILLNAIDPAVRFVLRNQGVELLSHQFCEVLSSGVLASLNPLGSTKHPPHITH